MVYLDDLGNIKDFVFENTFIKKNKHYTFFVVNTTDKEIVSGWEYKEDANDHRREYIEDLETANEKATIKVYTRAFAERFFLKLKEDSNGL